MSKFVIADILLKKKKKVVTLKCDRQISRIFSKLAKKKTRVEEPLTARFDLLLHYPSSKLVCGRFSTVFTQK